MMSSQVSWWIFWVISAVCILNVEFNIVEGGAYEETKVHIVYLGEKEHNDPELVTASHLRMLESLLGSKKDASESIVHSYRHGFSGFAAHLTDSQAKKISEHPDVVQVTPNSFYELQTTRTFDYLGLSHNTPKGLLQKAKMGKDIIIGVLDSGVWPESQSFNDKGLGPIPKRWKGMCVDGEDFDSKKHCNKKLIGARYYMDSLFRRNKTDSRIPDTEYMSAREGLPHGTHVASTAGGSFVSNARTSYKGNKIQGDLMYVYSTDEMTSAAKGKVVLSFTTGSEESQSDYVTKLLEVEAKAVIIAAKRDDVIKVSEGLPVIMVDYEHGSTIWKYISITRSPTIKISSAIALNGPLVATKVADFSGRGPNSISPYVLKPDVAAPGVAIVAASTPEDMSTNDGVAAQSGTSMATPVVAGLVALLRAVHPDWSPAALKSALITTASTTDPYGEPIFSEGMTRKLADPFDFGGGLVNPNKAADPGLVYDIGAEDYRLFLCASDYDERQITKISKTNTPYRCPSPRPSMLDLNLPSITIPFLKEDVTLTRTVTNVGPVNSVYKLVVEPPLGVKISVTPKILLFNSNVKKISFKVTVSTTHKSNSIYYFGSLTWTDGSHKVTIPLSVRTQMLMYFDQ
ncbi:unnamed protein product [Arabidopsis arenosa]|uniref:Uncharacterized protein n=1 Tax=Arabidopsis arenosa TaxID=38785 RepID=A0A8S2AGR2_ARAAE|nr:unnamed protein product [Arabidopsis arenosa]